MSRNQGTSAGGVPPAPRVVALLVDDMWTHDLANAIQVFGDGTPLLSHVADLGFVSSGSSAALDHGITVRTMPIDTCHEVPDLICVPGFADPSHAAWTDGEDEALSWLCRCHAAGAEVASLGTGAFVLARTGLLDGVRCTTHYAFVSEFRRLFPAALLDEETIFRRSRPPHLDLCGRGHRGSISASHLSCTSRGLLCHLRWLRR